MRQTSQATPIGEPATVQVTFKLNGTAVPAREFPERRYDTGGPIPLAPDLARKALNAMKSIFEEQARRLESSPS
jgi:hypothetical protein